MSTYHPKNALIFGGAGFVGRHLAYELAKQDWNVSVVTRRPHRHRDLIVMPTIKLIEVKQLNPETIRSLLSENDTVFNLIGILHESKRHGFDAIHTQLPGNIADIGMERGIRRLIHISALGADINAPSKYLQSKAHGERVLVNRKNLGLQFDIIRPSIVFGPDDSFTRLFARLLKIAKFIFFVISPDAKMQPVFVGDLVKCIVHAANQQHSSCKSFDVAGPDVFTFYELIRSIDELSGGHHRLIRLNDSLTRMIANFAQFAPGKLLTPDNVLSLQVPNVIDTEQPAPYGAQTRRFEDTAASWLKPQTRRFDAYRTQAGR
ncbi:MAG: complex I NDUFA9 subunit family protein [Acidiferrobacterales bacterium]|nr:complex I NDUFA9 subunit family protein [Acidiferrobacterales bacterium]